MGVNMLKLKYIINKLFYNTPKILIFTTLLAIILTLHGCKKIKTINNPMALGTINNQTYIINTSGDVLSLNKYDEVKPYYDDYLMVSKKGKWGYIKNTGEEVTKINYEIVYPMKENKAVIKEEGKFKVIDNLGNVLYLFPNEYSSSSFFQNNLLLIEKNGLYGYLKYDEENNDLTIFVEPIYDYGDTFYEGFACIGKINDGFMKYSYLNTSGQNIYGDFFFDYADRVSCGRAKVGFNVIAKTYFQYLIMPELTSSFPVKPTYLISNLTNQIIKYEYATTFSNNMAFVANYVYYPEGSEETNTQYYKDYSFVDVNGNHDYEYGIDDIGKKVPKNFYPYSPFFINDILIFFNATRSIPVCKIIRETRYKQSNGDDGYDTIHEFKEATFNINEDDPIIQRLLKEQKWTYRMASSYLTLPYELKTAKWNKELNTYITAAKISSDKWSIIKIISTKKPKDDENDRNLDDYDITLEYIIPIIYDNIIY